MQMHVFIWESTEIDSYPGNLIKSCIRIPSIYSELWSGKKNERNFSAA